MKLFLSTVALAIAIASPALADMQASHRDKAAYTARAQAPAAEQSFAFAVNASPYQHRPEYDVYVNGEYAGSDPDPIIREHLQQEWVGQNGN